MTLPEWDADGLLPVGRWKTDLSGIYDRFVLDAPNTDVRQQLFEGLSLYLDRVATFTGPAEVWIDGGFAMHKDAPPNDIDVVIFPENLDALNNLGEDDREAFLSYLTLQNVAFSGYRAKRVQPMAGILDAFIATMEEASYWHNMWSKVKLLGVEVVGATKGYAEIKIK